MSPSDREIIELNIKFYGKKLQTESDESKRRTIAALLAEEKAKLTKMVRPVSGRSSPRTNPDQCEGLTSS